MKRGLIERMSRHILYLGAALFLSGCVAVPVLFLAGAGAAGFAVHKVVQTQSGGEIKVAFPAKDGHEAPPQALPSGHRVAVWTGGEREEQFLKSLDASGEFSTISLPRTVAIFERQHLKTDFRQSSEEEQTKAFSSMCQATNADLVFAASDAGVSDEKKLLSFDRGATTYTIDLVGFSCAQNTVLWREQMALIEEHGKAKVTGSERAQVAGEMWAERVIVSRRAGERGKSRAASER